MKFSEDSGQTGYAIHSYSEGRIDLTVPSAGDSEHRETLIVNTSVVLTTERLIADWPPGSVNELERTHFEMVAELSPELVVFGSGARIAFPSPSVLEPLIRRGIGCEVMDTGAACRTFNVLAAEGRRVAAALLMI